MKRKFNKTGMLTLIMVSVVSCAQITSVNSYGAKAAKEDSTLEVKEMLLYAIQDEYLANKEYGMIMDEYGQQRPFSNIKKAEERHISMLKTALSNKIEIPKDESSGIVKLPESLNEAYKAGVEAEIENIAMYERFLQQELPKDVRQVFESLKDASENHLRAFRRFSEN
jgi:hypothetical protein